MAEVKDTPSGAEDFKAPYENHDVDIPVHLTSNVMTGDASQDVAKVLREVSVVRKAQEAEDAFQTQRKESEAAYAKEQREKQLSSLYNELINRSVQQFLEQPRLQNRPNVIQSSLRNQTENWNALSQLVTPDELREIQQKLVGTIRIKIEDARREAAEAKIEADRLVREQELATAESEESFDEASLNEQSSEQLDGILRELSEDDGVFQPAELSDLDLSEGIVAEEPFEPGPDYDALVRDMLPENGAPTDNKPEKTGFGQVVSEFFTNLRSRKEAANLRKEYAKVMEVFKNRDAAVTVVLVGANGEPLSHEFVVTPDSDFMREVFGLDTSEVVEGEDFDDDEALADKVLASIVEQLLERDDFRSVSQDKKSPPYVFDELRVAIRPAKAGEFAQKMESDPIRLLVLNTGAEKGHLGDEPLEHLRVGAAEVQAQMIRIQEVLDEPLDAIEQEIDDIGDLPQELVFEGKSTREIQEELTKYKRNLSSRESKINRKLNTIADLIRKDSESTTSVFGAIEQASEAAARYGTWERDAIGEGHPLHEKYQKFLQAYDRLLHFTDTVDELRELEEERNDLGKKSKKDRDARAELQNQINAIRQELEQLIDPITFALEVRTPLMDFFESIREQSVSLFSRELTKATEGARVEAYKQRLGIQVAPEDPMLDLLEDFDPDIRQKVEAFRMQLPLEQQGAIADALLGEVFKRYEGSVQSGFNRVMEAFPNISEEEQRAVFDAYTDVVESVSGYYYARENVSQRFAPVLLRVMYLLSQGASPEVRNVLESSGLVPAGFDVAAASSNDVYDLLDTWLEQLMGAENPPFGPIENLFNDLNNFVGNADLRGFENWFRNNDQQAGLIDAGAEQSVLGGNIALDNLVAPLTGNSSPEVEFGTPVQLDSAGNTRKVSAERILSDGYLDRSVAMLAQGKSLHDYFDASQKVSAAVLRLRAMVQENGDPAKLELIERDDLLRGSLDMYTIVHSLADWSDSNPGDGLVVAQHMANTTQALNQEVDRQYTDLALQVQESLKK